MTETPDSFPEMLATGELLQEFRAAQEVVRNTPSGSAFHRQAKSFITENANRRVLWKVPCMICGSEFDFWTTVAESVQMLGPPRGLCGPCAGMQNDGTVVVVV